MISLAETLLTNETITKLDVSNQYKRTPMGIIFQDDSSVKFLISLIEDSLTRRNEFFISPFFHFFLTKDEAEKKLLEREPPSVSNYSPRTPRKSNSEENKSRSYSNPENFTENINQRNSNSQIFSENSEIVHPSDKNFNQNEGRFLFYLNKSIPDTIQLCFVAKTPSSSSSPLNKTPCKLKIYHKTIYRVNLGYTFSRSPNVSIPSLSSYCCWNLHSLSSSFIQNEKLPLEIKKMIENSKNFNHLWRIFDIPSLDQMSTTKNVYPSLQNLISKNRNYLKISINRRI